MLCAGLASCEMKDEILGDKGTSGAVGYLDMSVAVDAALENIQTKADSEETVGTGRQQADGFLVELTGPNDYSNTFTYQSDMEPIALPVGEGYEAYAHSNIEGGLQKKMSEPFYGARESFNITESINSTINIACVAENTKFQLIYDPEFTAMYKQWVITVTAGLNESGCSETYEYNKATDGDTPQNPAPVYFYLENDVKSFIVSVNATTEKDNIPVRISKSFPKADNSAYTGGEAVNITMLPGDPDATINGQASIEIDVELFSPYEDINEPIQIEGEEPTTPEKPGTGPEEPEEPSGEIPTITLSGTEYTLPADMSETVNATITAPAGLKSVHVQIVGGNDQFQDIASSLLDGGDLELIGCTNSVLTGALSSMHVELPEEGDTKYLFPVSVFFTFLDPSMMGATTSPEGHVFNITVTDANDEQAKASLQVHAVETTTTE